jgi:very-short-patch-repair endonuclease
MPIYYDPTPTGFALLLQQALSDLGLKTQLEKPIRTAAGRFSMDIYIPDARVDVEVDGGHHRILLRMREDAMRDAAIEAAGIAVLRFSNAEVSQKLGKVANRIASYCLRRSKR